MNLDDDELDDIICGEVNYAKHLGFSSYWTLILRGLAVHISLISTSFMNNMSAPMNNNNNENSQIQEESKEGMTVARGTPYNNSADNAALRGQSDSQLLVRSEDDGASPVENSSAAALVRGHGR
jgi:hypothetical protein